MPLCPSSCLRQTLCLCRPMQTRCLGRYSSHPWSLGRRSSLGHANRLGLATGLNLSSWSARLPSANRGSPNGHPTTTTCRWVVKVRRNPQNSVGTCEPSIANTRQHRIARANKAVSAQVLITLNQISVYSLPVTRTPCCWHTRDLFAQ